ncbi:zinc finger protein 37 isoform X2 [Ceratitis capitata]|nr:zinc finger protein 37 isoform X2 [Ceratitis capitata]XP_020714377.1 zinc finger protein 37 isoform X2 [Ceratitis capitata]XP_020714378.1 zinc finger protein 37 isoform X2 [Ceratitis capitata]XP_020714379.1 zinc finger protein 37 isoform X2 [Ceratitis capitata]
MQHMYEDHIIEISPPKIELEDEEYIRTDEEMEHSDISLQDGKNLEEVNKSEFDMGSFERVEIELDAADIDNKEEVIPKEFVREDSLESESIDKDEYCSGISEDDYEAPDEINEDDLSESSFLPSGSLKKQRALNINAKRKFIIELIEVYHSCRALWDPKCREYTDRMVRNQQYDILLAKYQEKYPNSTKDDVRQKIFRLRTTFRRESKKISNEKSPLYYFEAMTFLLDHEKRKEYNERRELEKLEILATMELISQKEEIKCGEITTQFSVNKQEFFLNCVYCSYTFVKLENFVRHMYEDHLSELKLRKESQANYEQFQNRKDSEEYEGDLSQLKEFERVELGLDTEDSQEELYNEWAIADENSDAKTDPKGTYDTASTMEEDEKIQKKIDVKTIFSDTKMQEIFSSFAQHQNLWDIKLKKPSTKEREKLFQNIASDVGMPDEIESIRKLIIKLRYKLQTELVRRKIYESNGREYLPAWYTDLKVFLKQRPYRTKENKLLQQQQPKVKRKVKAEEENNDILSTAALADIHYITLADLYKKVSCLWDENDIMYRFSNRRSEALENLLKDFNSKSGLCLSQFDLECEISKLRKICSNEKKFKIRCKQNKTLYKSQCPFYKSIEFIEVNVAPFECSLCEEILPSLAQYRTHLSSHNGSLPYKCSICGREFKQTNNLTVHLRRHTKEYLYKCQVCEKPCVTSGDLGIHMRTHTGDKPFFCDVCGKRFQTSSLFSIHMRRHENRPRFHCELCDKPFYTSSTLKEHMNQHLKIRDKICNVCSKGFSTRKHLRQHKLIHSTEKKYSCKICAKRFAQHAGLSIHMKSHGTTLSSLTDLQCVEIQPNKK